MDIIHRFLWAIEQGDPVPYEMLQDLAIELLPMVEENGLWQKRASRHLLAGAAAMGLHMPKDATVWEVLSAIAVMEAKRKLAADQRRQQRKRTEKERKYE